MAEHQLRVYGEDDSVIATFTEAKCSHKVFSSGPHFEATAVSTDGGSELKVIIPQFEGFKKEYEVEQGSTVPLPFVVFVEKGSESNTFYTSYYEPPAPSPGFGIIAFREAGHLLGVGYGPAMWTSRGDAAVSLTGVVECEKPQKPKKGKGGKKGKGPTKGKPGKS